MKEGIVIKKQVAENKYIVGIDVGGTKCAVVLGQTSENGNTLLILDKIRFETEISKGPNYIIQQMVECIKKILSQHNLSNESIRSIGISCGGPLDHVTGVIKNPPNLIGWDNIPIVQMIQDTFGIPTYLQNDANACALAEWKYGAAKGCRNIVFLTCGTGMGAGLILNGQLYNGVNDNAGEVGHIRLAECGPVGYGKAGSFEGFCSGNGISQLAQLKVVEKIQMGILPDFCPGMDYLSSLTAKKVAEAAYNGDPLALEIYKTSGYYYGKALSIIIDLLNPEMIVLGSVYERSGSLFEETMQETIQKESLSLSREVCRIVPAKLGDSIGDYAALSVAVYGGEHE